MSSPPLQACFNDLPKEIRMRIAELAKIQDEVYNSRTKLDAKEKLRNKEAGGWHGKSLQSLALVSKDLNKCTAKYIFETLYSSHFEEYPDRLRMTSLVLAERAVNFRTVRFANEYNESPSARQAVILALSFLPNVQRLIIPNSKTDLLHTSLRLAISSPSQQIGQKITQLELGSLEPMQPTEIVSLLEFFPQLHRLEIDLSSAWPDETTLRPLIQALVKQSKLRHLAIRHGSTGLKPWTELNADTLPLLNSLSVSSTNWNSTHALSFVKPFASRLTSLKISFKTFVTPPPQPTPPHLRSRRLSTPSHHPTPHLSFPSLQNISIQAEEVSEDCSLGDALEDCQFPAVQSLALFYPLAYRDVSHRSVMKIFPRVQRMQLSNKLEGIARGPMGATDYEALKEGNCLNFVGEELCFSPHYNAFHPPTELPYPDYSPLEVAKEEELQEKFMWRRGEAAVEFAKSELERMKLLGDVAGMKRIMPCLSSFEEMRLWATE